MADANITFAAPGVLKAAREVGLLRSQVSLLGTTEIKVQNIRKKGAVEAVRQESALRRSINRTTAAIGKQIAAFRARRRQAGSVFGAGGTAQNAGQAISRAGGAAGGVFGQLSEAAGLSGPLAAIAGGAIAAGLALNGLAAASDRQAEIAGRIVQAGQQVTDALKGIGSANDSAANAFATSNVQPFRELVSRRGGKGLVGEAERLQGLGIDDAPQQLLAAIKTGVFDALGTRRTGELIETGNRLGIAPDFTQLQGLGPRSLKRLQQTGQLSDRLFGVDTDRALQLQSRFSNTQIGSSFDRVQDTAGQVAAEVFERFVGGRGTVPNIERLNELRSEEATAILRVNAALEREEEVLRARADAEWEVVRRFKELGSIFGFSRSASQELGDQAAIRNGLTN